MFTNARDWLNGAGMNNGKDMATNFEKSYGGDVQSNEQNNVGRQRSKSLAYIERRDIIIPGPVF
jgi:hypothetical protein